MPLRPPRECSYPGCSELIRGADRCERHQVHKARFGADFRKSAKTGASARGYTYRWQKARKSYLIRHPYCRECQRNGKLTLANIVDHIIPHEGDQRLMWDRDNWQPLCAKCHGRKNYQESMQKIRQKRMGIV